MTSISQSIISKLKGFSTCEISDALIKLSVPHGGHIPGLDLYSPSGVSHDNQTRICGPAFTVKMVSQADKSAPKPEKHFVDAAEPNSVMVVTAPSNTRSAIWGGLMTARAQSMGVQGVILDGRCRDLLEHRESKFSVFSRGHSTLGQSPFTRPSELQIPLIIKDPTTIGDGEDSFPEITVNPGDLVLADLDGVVIVEPKLVEKVLELAEKGREIDEKCMKDLKDGKTIQETFKLHRGK